MVPLPASTLCPTIDQAVSSSVSGCRSRASLQSISSMLQGMATGWFSAIEDSCSMEVQQVLLNSRKTSTHTTNLKKRKRFIYWYNRHYLRPELVPLSVILDYLPGLKTCELSISSVKVHLAAISAFHPLIEGFSIFAHPISSRFIKGLGNLFSHIRHPIQLGTSTWFSATS